jgi:hypothetical protein
MAGILRIGPSLWLPGQAFPNGVPGIDWTHPLAKGLTSYWFAVNDSTYLDLVTFDSTVKGAGTKNVLPIAKPTKFGRGPGFTLGTHFCQSSRVTASFAVAAPYSCVCGWYQLGAPTISTGNPGWFGVADTANSTPFAVYIPGAGQVGISFGNVASPFAFSVVADTFYVAVGAATGVAAQSSWINGIAQTAGTGTSAFTGTSDTYCFGDMDKDAGTTTAFVNSTIFFGAYYSKRALTQQDAIQFYTDPYCFLIPPEGEMPALAVTAADILRAQIWL